MTISIDSVLNWLVPVIIILVFAGILYTKMKEPIDQVFKWIGGLFRAGADKMGDRTQEYTTVYRYG